MFVFTLGLYWEETYARASRHFEVIRLGFASFCVCCSGFMELQSLSPSQSVWQILQKISKCKRLQIQILISAEFQANILDKLKCSERPFFLKCSGFLSHVWLVHITTWKINDRALWNNSREWTELILEMKINKENMRQVTESNRITGKH